MYKNVRLGVVALVFHASVTSGVLGPTEESAAVDWWTADQIAEHMAETFAIRVLDALVSDEVQVRLHDGSQLLVKPYGKSLAKRLAFKICLD